MLIQPLCCCSIYPMYGLFFPFFFDCFSIQQCSQTQLLSDITESGSVPLTVTWSFPSPDIIQYIPRLLLFFIMFIYLLEVGSFSLLACPPHPPLYFQICFQQVLCIVICAHDQQTRGAHRREHISCLWYNPTLSLLVSDHISLLYWCYHSFVIRSTVRRLTVFNTLLNIPTPIRRLYWI